MPSRPSVSKTREEVNCVPLSVVSVKFSSRLPSGSRSSTACSPAASASSLRQRCPRFHPTLSRPPHSITTTSSPHPPPVPPPLFFTPPSPTSLPSLHSP